MGHVARDCPEKKVKDSSGGSSGVFTMMCIEVANPQELNLEEKSEMQTEKESLTLQDWINQSHKNEIRLEQAYVTEIRCQNNQSRKEDPHLEELLYQPEVTILKMNKDQNNEANNKDKENDCKPSAQEMKQADKKKKADEEYESDYTTDSQKPKKKKR